MSLQSGKSEWVADAALCLILGMVYTASPLSAGVCRDRKREGAHLDRWFLDSMLQADLGRPVIYSLNFMVSQSL